MFVTKSRQGIFEMISDGNAITEVTIFNMTLHIFIDFIKEAKSKEDTMIKSDLRKGLTIQHILQIPK